MGPEQGLLRIERELAVFANLRPVRAVAVGAVLREAPTADLGGAATTEEMGDAVLRALRRDEPQGSRDLE